MAESSTVAKRALQDLSTMAQQIRGGHARSAHIRADMTMLVSEVASFLVGEDRGAFVTRVLWTYPQYVEYRPVADVLGVMPCSLRVAVGK